ncbi:MAG: hypothetical protein HGA85_05820 [Nanoarchaeota archaeon]|nr:hypothetical protein [Nanoarchaeota archaeon]
MGQNKLIFVIVLIAVSALGCIFATYMNFTPTKEIAKNDALIFDIFALTFGTILVIDGILAIFNEKHKELKHYVFPVLRIFAGTNVFVLHVILFYFKYLS